MNDTDARRDQAIAANTPIGWPKAADTEATDPVDPDTLFLTRAAQTVLAYWNTADQAARDAAADPDMRWAAHNASGRALTALSVWEDLTGLTPEDALEYAHRLAVQDQEVAAHVRPF